MLYEKEADKDGHLLFLRYTKENAHGYDSMPHFHNSVEFFFVANGSYTIYVGGEKRTLKCGDVAFIDRLTPHTAGAEKIDSELEVYVVVASEKYLDGVRFLEVETLQPFTEKKEGFEKILSFLRLSFGLREEMNEEMRRGFVTMLLGLAKDYCTPIPRSSEKSNSLLTNVMSYINDSYCESITLDGIARRFGYEKTYLSRTFNSILGMNLREYVNRVRINAVKKERKKNPNTPIYRIAEACGFENLNTFYRAYKKYST